MNNVPEYGIYRPVCVVSRILLNSFVCSHHTLWLSRLNCHVHNCHCRNSRTGIFCKHVLHTFRPNKWHHIVHGNRSKSLVVHDILLKALKKHEVLIDWLMKFERFFFHFFVKYAELRSISSNNLRVVVVVGFMQPHVTRASTTIKRQNLKIIILFLLFEIQNEKINWTTTTSHILTSNTEKINIFSFIFTCTKFLHKCFSLNTDVAICLCILTIFGERVETSFCKILLFLHWAVRDEIVLISSRLFSASGYCSRWEIRFSTVAFCLHAIKVCQIPGRKPLAAWGHCRYTAYFEWYYRFESNVTDFNEMTIATNESFFFFGKYFIQFNGINDIYLMFRINERIDKTWIYYQF